MEKEDNLLKVMSDVSYCSDKYQYTMGKSFLECGMKDKIAYFNLFTARPRTTTTGL